MALSDKLGYVVESDIFILQLEVHGCKTGLIHFCLGIYCLLFMYNVVSLGLLVNVYFDVLGLV